MMGHKITAPVLLISVFLIMLNRAPLAALSAVEPLIYPAGEIGRNRPLFIWQDIYRERDAGLNVSYRLTLQSERDNEIRVYNFDPLPRFRTFYLYTFPSGLVNGSYSYSIERLVAGAFSDARFFTRTGIRLFSDLRSTPETQVHPTLSGLTISFAIFTLKGKTLFQTVITPCSFPPAPL
jgi:hypothetical protein